MDAAGVVQAQSIQADEETKGEEMTEAQPKKLNKAQEVFVSEYLQCFNATEAYSRAYPKAKRTTAGANGHELLKKTEIAEQIQARLAEVHMSADEALKRLADMARGDIGQFMDRLGGLDIQSARDAGLTPLIKKIKQRTVTKIGKKDDDDDIETHDLEIELYSAKDAIETILRVNGKLKGDAPVINIVKGYIGWTPENWKDDEPKDISPI